MGFFSDKCQALIDPNTNRALKGQALAEVKQDAHKEKSWPRCGHSVKKAARFCSKCGSGAPGGWWKCHACGKWVGNESNFCWNCKTPLHPETRDLVSGGVWQKAVDTFAERIEVGEVKQLLTQGLNVQEGTAAILLDGGKCVDVLSPGRHNPDSLAHKINWFGNPPPRTTVLIESGDVVLPLRVEDLRSSEDIPVEFYTEVSLHFTEKRAAEFMGNLMKMQPRLTYSDLAAVLAGEIRYATANFCTRSTIEDLVKDPDRRLHLEDELQKTLQVALERYGLEIVRIASVEFTGRAYQELLAKSGDVELKRRELEFDQKLREIVAKDRMGQFKTEHELNDYVGQLAQERGVSALHRDHELSRLKQVQRHELTKADALFQMDQETARARHDLGLRAMKDDYERESSLKDDEAERKKADGWLDVRKKKLEIGREDLKGRVDILEGKSMETLLSVLPEGDPRMDRLMELQRELSKKGRSAEEILALEAGKSPAAAQALAQLVALQRQQQDKSMEEKSRVLEESAARLERILTAALATTAEAARHPGSSTQIVK